MKLNNGTFELIVLAVIGISIYGYIGISVYGYINSEENYNDDSSSSNYSHSDYEENYNDDSSSSNYSYSDYEEDEDENNNSMSRTPCRVCKGTGQMPVRGGGIVLGTQTCQGCGGSGYHLSW